MRTARGDAVLAKRSRKERRLHTADSDGVWTAAP